ncbi:protein DETOXIFICATION 16-like isoform X2 [Mercurialis annua]|uniref:protein DETOXIFICATION 16-like isoform X2 n=1 Tax=Mercurialis annua TaxID=3986 RepID=UPI00215F3B72|nr:protein DETOXIFICATION 16-like isoform X2 [Mercurialis annua]
MEVQEENPSIESPLLISEGGRLLEQKHRFTADEFFIELKKQLNLAGPLVSVNFLIYLLQVISVMFVGHLGELSLAGASMATSFASVTGFSLLKGMASGLDTFCGQSYGAKQYHMLGIHLQRAMIVLLLVSIPLAFIWANAGEILLFFRQDPEISAEAGRYAHFMIPSIFAFAIQECLVRFLQTQNNVVPMMICSGFTTLLHIFICWILVFKSGLGNKGAALANAISYWIYAILLILYVSISPSCKKTWTGFSKQALHGIPKYLKLAIPSAVMLSLETWSFEMMVLLSGLLPNPKLETSVLSISLNTSSMAFMIPLGLGGVISTEERVVQYVGQMLIFVAATHFLDGIQSVLSGTCRGCGWQKLGAIINLGAYYLIGIPCSILFAFVYNFGGKGLWTGLIVALLVQSLGLSTVTLTTNWEKESKKAKDRVYNSNNVTFIPEEIRS